MVSSSHLGSTDSPTILCVEPVAFLLFWHPLSLNVTWLDALESAIHMSLLFNVVMDAIMVLVPCPYCLSMVSCHHLVGLFIGSHFLWTPLVVVAFYLDRPLLVFYLASSQFLHLSMVYFGLFLKFKPIAQVCIIRFLI